MSTGVKVVDHGANAMLARARELAKGRVVRVGVLDEAAPKDVKPGEKPPPYTNAMVAAVHEFGAPAAHIPQRSFLRSTLDERREEIASAQAKLAVRALEGKVEHGTALNQLGAKVAGMVVAKINSNIPPKLADETIDRKNSSVALISTGQLKSSITWKVMGG